LIILYNIFLSDSIDELIGPRYIIILAPSLATTMGISYTSSNGALGTPPMANTATSITSGMFLNLMLVDFLLNKLSLDWFYGLALVTFKRGPHCTIFLVISVGNQSVPRQFLLITHLLP
jgi:hypothetical protein